MKTNIVAQSRDEKSIESEIEISRHPAVTVANVGVD